MLSVKLFLLATMIPVAFRGPDRGKRVSPSLLPGAAPGPCRTASTVTSSPRRRAPLAAKNTPLHAAIQPASCSDRVRTGRKTSKKTKNLKVQPLHAPVLPVSRDVAIKAFFNVMMTEAHGGKMRFDRIAKNYDQMRATDGRNWPPLKDKALSQGLRKLGCTGKVTTTKTKDGTRPTIFTFPKRRARREAA